MKSHTQLVRTAVTPEKMLILLPSVAYNSNNPTHKTRNRLPDGRVGPVGLNEPGTLHVGGVVARRLGYPPSRPLLRQLYLAAAQLAVGAPPALPAHAGGALGAPVAAAAGPAGGHDTVPVEAGALALGHVRRGLDCTFDA